MKHKRGEKREKMERNRKERARGMGVRNLRGDGLCVGLGFSNHICLIPEFQVNDGGQ